VKIKSGDLKPLQKQGATEKPYESGNNKTTE